METTTEMKWDVDLLEKVLSDCVGKLAAIVEVTAGEWNTPDWIIPPAWKTSDWGKLPLSTRERFTSV